MSPNMIVQLLLQQNPALKNNMFVAQALEKLQQGDENGVREIAQNLCNEKGLDINKQLNNVKSQFGI